MIQTSIPTSWGFHHFLIQSLPIHQNDYTVAEILGGGALAPPLFEEGGQCPPHFFLRTEQFKLKLELFLAIYTSEDGGGF